MRNKNTFKYLAIGLVVLAVAAFGWNAFAPGKLDAFAQCLGDKGAKFYGAFWCPHCQQQKQIFANSAKKLPYVECSAPDGKSQLAVCTEKGIQSYPTWIFADESRENKVMSPEQLATKTGCALPE